MIKISEHDLAQLRHAYMLLVNGYTNNMAELARGIISPVIASAEHSESKEKFA